MIQKKIFGYIFLNVIKQIHLYLIWANIRGNQTKKQEFNMKIIMLSDTTLLINVLFIIKIFNCMKWIKDKINLR
jgi:hypothetical protein